MIANYTKGLGDEALQQTFLEDITDYQNWDWHEWLIVGVLGYLVVNKITSGIKSGVRGVKKIGAEREKRKSRKRQLKRELDDLGWF